MTVLLLLVFSAVVLGGWCATRVRRRRRRAHATMVITSFPAIELTQPYGGWDADAYDAGTGRDRRPGLFAGALTPGRCLVSRPVGRPR
jgi:hypothetical protein